MKGILVAQFKIADPESYRLYAVRSAPAVKAAGSTYIAAGAPQAVLEGEEHPDRVAIVEFESLAKATQFYESSAYQEARRERRNGVEARFVLLSGAEPSPRADGWSVESWARFWSKPDPEVARQRVQTVVQPDVVGYWPASSRAVRGKSDYLQRVLDFIDFVPDLSLQVDEYAYGTDIAFIRWSGRGTGPNGRFECVGVDRFKFRGGLVIENRIISDHQIFRLLASKVGEFDE